MRFLNKSIAVSGQIRPEEIERLSGEGFRTLINNRPDGEDAAQPEGEAIAAAARAAGLRYYAIPVTHAGFSAPQVEAMAKALDEAEGPVLAFCRSGTRSTLLWALARARGGESPADLAAQAAGAGYDLAPVASLLDMLSASSASHADAHADAHGDAPFEARR